jgi:hypothetical protein
MWNIVGLFASLFAGVLGAHFGYILCNDHPAAFLMALVLGRWTYLGFADIQAVFDEGIDIPQPKTYDLTALEAMSVLRQTLTYTSLGDKWWHIRDMNLDDGRMLTSVNFEDEYGRFADVHFSKDRIVAKTQIVLVIEVKPAVGGKTSVFYRFVVTTTYGRRGATALIKQMQETFDEALEKRSAQKKEIRVGEAA